MVKKTVQKWITIEVNLSNRDPPCILNENFSGTRSCSVNFQVRYFLKLKIYNSITMSVLSGSSKTSINFTMCRWLQIFIISASRCALSGLESSFFSMIFTATRSPVSLFCASNTLEKFPLSIEKRLWEYMSVLKRYRNSDSYPSSSFPNWYFSLNNCVASCVMFIFSNSKRIWVKHFLLVFLPNLQCTTITSIGVMMMKAIPKKKCIKISEKLEGPINFQKKLPVISRATTVKDSKMNRSVATITTITAQGIFIHIFVIIHIK